MPCPVHQANSRTAVAAAASQAVLEKEPDKAQVVADFARALRVLAQQPGIREVLTDTQYVHPEELGLKIQLSAGNSSPGRSYDTAYAVKLEMTRGGPVLLVSNGGPISRPRRYSADALRTSELVALNQAGELDTLFAAVLDGIASATSGRKSSR